jgi:BTB/POZ domain
MISTHEAIIPVNMIRNDVQKAGQYASKTKTPCTILSEILSFCFFLFCSIRSFYFEAMFRPGGMVESSKGEIQMARHDKNTFCRMMEFIYTGAYLFWMFYNGENSVLAALVLR